MEFAADGPGLLTGLALLLASSNGPDGRGGGDWHPWLGGPGYEGREVDVDPERAKEVAAAVPGRWAGDRIAVIGDYAEKTDKGVGRFIDGVYYSDTPWGDPDEDEAGERRWTDISDLVLEALRMDYYLRQALPAPSGDGWRERPVAT